MNSAHTMIELNPDVLRWARERAALPIEELATKVNVKVERVIEWEQTGQISTAQVSKLASRTYTPLGFLYLPKPPDEQLPIQDFRTKPDSSSRVPSPDLLDTVYSMQRRQSWMRNELIEAGAGPLRFVGSVSTQSSALSAANSMRKVFGLSEEWASETGSWEEARRYLREKVEHAGILVVSNGVVGNNTHRRLDPEEFRGFALVDDYAPLVFINSADVKSAQIFTLIHECAHVWLGISAVSNFDRLRPMSHRVEVWCNAVAGEFLVPEREFTYVWDRLPSHSRINAAARRFKVSNLVIARRALDLNLIGQDSYDEEFENSRLRENKDSGGGNFWNTQSARIGPRFGDAVIRAVKEGRLLYRDAYHLTGLKAHTFNRYIEEMGY